ncbi:hypothetical protein FG05_35201 [Fusarium graminearum]|nr:hypothetical protein FG05_35201 [Fusarium graminearum]
MEKKKMRDGRRSFLIVGKPRKLIQAGCLSNTNQTPM